MKGGVMKIKIIHPAIDENSSGAEGGIKSKV